MNFTLLLALLLFVLSGIFLVISFITINNAHNIKTIKDNEIRQQEQEKEQIQKNIITLSNKKTQILEDITKEKEKFEQIYNNEKNKIDLQLKKYQERTNLASEKYFENLETEYENAEIAYNNKINKLNLEYAQTNQELQKIKDTLAASIQARIREKEIQDNLSFYCLQISDVDKLDIQRLEQVKKTLSKPRVLSMLIWQTWFQKPLKALCANVLGTSEKTGIYKITNVETGECYIGQATNTASRWIDHAKCGLGIDTPANNKLYKAMQEYGLWSFSWELLEECPREQLNEKEKYYIGLYDSYNFGYNSTIGNK
jgi:hypothetical protein